MSKVNPVLAEAEKQACYRIAFLTEQADVGGGETSLLYLIEFMKDLGQQVCLICPPGRLADFARGKSIQVRTIVFHDAHLRFGIIPTISVRDIFRLLGVIRSFNADLVHAESPLSLLYGGIVAYLLNKPCVATCHGYWPLDSLFFRQYIRFFIKAIFPVSMTVANEALQFISKAKKISVAPLGVSESLANDLPSKNELRTSLDFPQDRVIIMQVARFQEIKGQMNLLRAYELLISDYNLDNCSLIYVGGTTKEGETDSRAYLKSVVGRANDLKPPCDVRFLNHRTDVPGLMKAADILVVPSLYETFGMSILEAMLVGTPVIATDCGGPSEIIENMVNGILVPPGDPVAIAEAIRLIIDNQELTAEIICNSKEIVGKEYGIRSRYEKLIGEYDNIAQTRNNNRSLLWARYKNPT